MTDLVAIALIGAVPASVAALGTVLNVIMIQAHGKVLNDQAGVIEKLEKNTNSIKDALVAKTAESSRAQGKLEGIAEEKSKL